LILKHIFYEIKQLFIMQIVNQVLTYLFATVFVVFGLNYWGNFIPLPMPTDPTSYPALFMKSTMETGFMTVVKVLEVIAGVMIAANFKRPLAWLLILPICVCIMLFEIFVAKEPGIGIALVAINLYMVYQNRQHYPFLTA
jgi:putative oxidoreductase